jgi:hypothetical protein
MTPIKKCYAELLALTQLFLLREYSPAEVKIVDPAIFGFFQKKMKATPLINQRRSSSKPMPSIPPSQVAPRAMAHPSSTEPPPPEAPPEPLPSPKPEPQPPHPLPPPTQPEPSPPEPQPPIIQDKQNKANFHSKALILETLAVPPTRDQREFWKLFPTLFPELRLSESIPSDSVAQKLKNAWLNDQVIPPVIILSFHQEEKQLNFLKNLAQAISLRLAPARVLSASKWEKENSWEHILNFPHLRLVIASDYGLYTQSALMRFYREIPQQGKHFLNHIPLLLLSDLALYLKEPQLKPLLWRAICNEFAASQRH